jgi:hypothetical protein
MLLNLVPNKKKFTKILLQLMNPNATLGCIFLKKKKKKKRGEREGERTQPLSQE